MPKTPQPSLAAQAGSMILGGDMTVHRLGYGAMRITGKGVWGPPPDRDAALATLRHVTELGVNFIDTADSYGPDVSEELIAEALHPYPEGLVIATKGGWQRVGPGQWTHNASPRHLEEAVAGSLRASAVGAHRPLPTPHSRSRRVVRCVDGDAGPHAGAGKDSPHRTLQRHTRTCGAGSQDGPHRLGSEPL